LKSLYLLFFILFTLCISFTSCNTTKYIKDQETLLSKNIINIDGKKTSKSEITSYLIQRPNNSLLGIPLGLHLYNLGNLKYDSIHSKKTEQFVDRNSFWDKILSKKQTLKLLKKKKSINDWFLTKGEAPIIVNNLKTKQTKQNLRTHFFNNGYFNSKIETLITSDLKKTTISYNITKNKPFSIGDISYKINSPSVKKAINEHLKRIPLKKNQQYKLENFKKTVSKITKTLRNNGFYNFNQSMVSFREIDTLSLKHTTPVEIHINNRKIKKDNKTIEQPTEIYKVESVKVYTDYTYKKRNQPYNTENTYHSLDFYAHSKLQMKSKTLANSIFIKPGQVYSDNSIELTRNHLRSLNNFKSIKITNKELDDRKLETTITLTPQKKYGIGLNTEIIHSNIKQIGLSGGFSFINRNLFKGAESLQISLQGSIFDTASNINNNDSESFNAYEIGIDASLAFPRFRFPFIGNLIPRKMTPKTKITIGTSFQKNIGLDKQKINGVIDYSWESSKKNRHNLELLNLQFINNLNPDSYYRIYTSQFNQIKEIQPLINPNFELTTRNASSFINNLPSNFVINNPEENTTLNNIKKREEIITSNNIIPSTSYSFEHNSRRGLSDTKYNFFKIKISSAGNFNTFFLKEENGLKTYEGIPISQFVKLDIDFRKFWSNSKNNSLAFRTFIGAAIPTGKNKEIPFIASYFAGGSNDIRAWKTYELGPGNSNSGLEFNIGNLKLLSSLEYRFKIINNIHGAIFVDAGNIWNLPNTSGATDDEIFDSLQSLENIAIGSGLGFRYDLSFLVLRFDLAFKTFEPYLIEDKWFSNYTLTESVLNIGINYPF